MAADSYPTASKKLPVAGSNATAACSSQTNATPHGHVDTGKQPSRASSLEIENLVKVNRKKVCNTESHLLMIIKRSTSFSQPAREFLTSIFG